MSTKRLRPNPAQEPPDGPRVVVGRVAMLDGVPPKSAFTRALPVGVMVVTRKGSSGKRCCTARMSGAAAFVSPAETV